MDNHEVNAITEIELHPQDLMALGAAWQGALNVLSPFPRTKDPHRSMRDNPALFTADGRLRSEAERLLPVLAAPTAISGLAVVSGESVQDLILYHKTGQPSVALVNTGQALRLIFPAPIPAVLSGIEKGLSQVTGDLPQFDLNLSIYEAYVLWAFLDVLRHRQIGEQASRINAAEVKEALDAPFDDLQNLAAYYRDCLLLPLPSDQEISQTCQALAEKEWIGIIGKDYLPGEMLLRLANALVDIPCHVLLRAGCMLENGEPVAIQVRMMQSSAGLGLVWYEFDDRVTLFTLDRIELLHLVNAMLASPASLFKEASVLIPPAREAAGPALSSARPTRKRPLWLTCGLIGIGVAAILCIAGVVGVFLVWILSHLA